MRKVLASTRRLRVGMKTWLRERSGWFEAAVNPAVVLNRRGARLSAQGANVAP